MDLAIVEPYVRPVWTRGQFLEEEVIVGPVVCLLYDPLEIFPEGPVVLRPLLVGLQWGLGGSRSGLVPWTRSRSG